jgi:hypothetical protein
VTETPESVDASPPDDETEESITELLGRLGRELSTLAFWEARLAAARNKSALRRTARDFVAVLVAVLAFLTAFVLANAAGVQALSTQLPDWAAPLVLATAWAGVGVVLSLFLLSRVRGVAGEEPTNPEEARDEAARAVRETLEHLAPAITKEIALAAVPMAGDMASGVVDASEEMIESVDEIVDAIAEDIPGGGVVNQIWDVVLMPGRLGIRVATTVLKRGNSGS